ncbi:serine phosphatase RsbU, regulator of sigma subunit [Bernardetia litoralis DSM 6794]|uniref:Serine phosphatase RsbU, regulator of sigma subunit n=1 Tax=Bernardetia litoralis (strain ATCC 23117 / DSM 6794 / NBRC 15988 / NCIMB 1366 / Fx l1 / Sio-4) TaxID=880071 RepID=I4ALY0_BERLS|nr:SpoIIE family protein phosphatase [Bernardetia litoralis]AFM04965.1 serine phosphatase RsbU, regulator of sigma subunit [Bernardetia litoralis DSM 6794]
MIKVQLFRSFIGFIVAIIPLLASLNCINSYAQSDVGFNATPFMRLYSPKEYQAGSINMAVKKDKKGILYFANTSGVLQFDGKTWRTIEVPDVNFIRALDIDENGTVFIGAVNQIGKLEADSTGKLEFVSLINLLDSADRSFGEIWKVKSTSQGTFFSTDKYVFRYQNGKIDKWTPKGKYFYSVYYVNDEVYVLDRGFGLRKLEDNKLQFVSNDNLITNSGIYFLLPYSNPVEQTKNNEILIGRNTSSLLIYTPNTNQFRVFETDLSEDEISSMYNAIRGKDGNYYISTLRHGVICINPAGKKVFQFSQKEGLTDKVYEVEFDNQQNLWAALSKGVAKIEIGSPFTKYGENRGISGIVTDATTHNNQFYISSTNGVFYYNKEQNHFLPLVGKSYQTWIMKTLALDNDSLFLAATNVGLHQIKKTSWNKFESTEGSANYLIESSTTPSRLYVGLSNSKGLYQLDILTNKKNDFKQVISNLTILGLEMQDSLLFVIDGEDKIHIYQEKDTLEEQDIEFNHTVRSIEKHNNQIYIAADSLVYVWNNNNFEIHKTISQLIKENEYVVEINNIDDENIILRIGGLDKTDYYLFNIKTNKYKNLPTKRLTDNSISIYSFLNAGGTINQVGKVAIGTSEGFFYLDINKKNYQKAEFNVFIRKIIQADSILFIENYTEQNNNPVLNYEQNSLTFFYSSNNSFDEQNTFFRYKLNGYDKKWSDWTTETKKEYTNLNAGKYSFELEAKNIYETKSRVTKYDFKIEPPFYKTPLAYILYFVIGILVVSILTYSGIRYNVRRLKYKNQKLEETVKERTSELRLSNSELEQQKEEVLMQKQNIENQKEELEKSYQNIQILADIGQQITATLDLTELIGMLYKNVNSLMPAEGFGIGVFNPYRQQINFRGFVESGQILPFNSDSLEDTQKLAVQSFVHQKEISTNNFDKDFPVYRTKELEVEELPQSLVYLPLIVQEKSIGVLTVQSFDKNAYQPNHLTILRSLASYAAIAVSNAQSYATINEKNQHITDSIRYARTIQAAVLPSKELIKNHIEEFFILYRPKDIVSGDFYWFTTVFDKEKNTTKVAIAAVDCTGHGVPGAFMSLIGNTFLHEIVDEKHITNPAQILENLDKILKNSLQKGEQKNKDGMDAAICVFEKTNIDEKVKVSFSGAKRPLWYALPNSSTLENISGTRRSIGSSRTKEKPFENNEFLLEKGTSIYLTTDGFADQSNPKGEKFGTHNLIKLIEKNLSLSMQEQGNQIEDTLNIHQGKIEQRDDITVLGFRV